MPDELKIASGQKVPHSPSPSYNVTPQSRRLRPSLDGPDRVPSPIFSKTRKYVESIEYILVHLMFDAPLHNSEEFSQGCTAVIALPRSSSITFKSLHAAIAASLNLEEKDENGKVVTHFAIAEWFAEHRITMENIDYLPALTKMYVRWQDRGMKLPDMEMKTDLDVQKGLGTMRQRGWRDELVVVWHVAHRFEWMPSSRRTSWIEREEAAAEEARSESDIEIWKKDHEWTDGF